jgi:hypothetical protein
MCWALSPLAAQPPGPANRSPDAHQPPGTVRLSGEMLHFARRISASLPIRRAVSRCAAPLGERAAVPRGAGRIARVMMRLSGEVTRIPSERFHTRRKRLRIPREMLRNLSRAVPHLPERLRIFPGQAARFWRDVAHSGRGCSLLAGTPRLIARCCAKGIRLTDPAAAAGVAPSSARASLSGQATLTPLSRCLPPHLRQIQKTRRSNRRKCGAAARSPPPIGCSQCVFRCLCDTPPPISAERRFGARPMLHGRCITFADLSCPPPRAALSRVGSARLASVVARPTQQRGGCALRRRRPDRQCI